MTNFKEWNLGSNVDLLVGGTPCQSFSVAGLRKGLDDPRGNLMLTYLAIAKQYRPNWLVWENVPGVLSSNGGRDFGSFLGGLAECGYGFAYRVLDAQYFGVAQRRRRVFVVGYLGDWRAAAAVLFERHSLQGHPAPSREKRQGIASYTPSSIGGYSEGVGTLRAHGGDIGGGSENLIASKHWPADISSTLDTTFGTKQGLENQHINAGCPMFVPVLKTLVGLQDCNNFSSEITGTIVTREGCAADTAHMVMQPIALAENTIGRQPQNGGNGDGFTDGGPMYTLNATGVHGVAQPICLMDQGGSVMNIEHDMTGTLRRETHGHEPIVMQPFGVDTYNGTETGQVSCTITADVGGPTHSGPKVLQSMAVRRLTPVECERLQGFGDNYTNIKSKNKPTPDGPRYKALGNSMAVPVMAWIGARIQQYEDMQ